MCRAFFTASLQQASAHFLLVLLTRYSPCKPLKPSLLGSCPRGTARFAPEFTGVYWTVYSTCQRKAGSGMAR
ncbi:hypothetical protein J3E69DRAFT_258379 [Trichoderma sp. SZMC 28015]